MNEPYVTKNQAAAAFTAALLSPLMRALPRSAVALAGRGAWLSLLPAIPFLLLLAGLMLSLGKARRPGEGMAGLMLRVLGPAGRVLLAVWCLFFLAYTAFILRSGAERLAAAVYQQSRPEPFILVMGVLGLIAALGALRAAVRTAYILRAVLLAVLAAAALLALPNVSLSNLFPLYKEDLSGVVLGAWPFVTLGSAGALFAFLAGSISPGAPTRRELAGPGAVLGGAGALLCLETVGTFGPALTGRLTYPFFTMVRDVSLFHLAQRIEAAVIALWVLADYLMCAFLLRCAHEALRTLLRLPPPERGAFLSLAGGRWLLWAEAGLVLLAACLLEPSAAELLQGTETWLPLILNGLVWGSFGLLWLVGRLRKML